MNTKSILIAGTGGQGALLASRLLESLLLEAGYDVKVSRAWDRQDGSVAACVRYGVRVDAPDIRRGEADILVALELLAAARRTSYLKPEGTLIANARQELPRPVITGAASYPEDLARNLRRVCRDPFLVDALAPARAAGSLKTVNVVLLGLLSTLLDLPEQSWQDALARCLKPALLQMNLSAFARGRALGRTA